MQNPKRIRLNKRNDILLATKPLIGGNKKYVGVYDLSTLSGRIVDATDEDESLVVDLGEMTIDKFISSLKGELVKLGVPFEKEIRNKQ